MQHSLEEIINNNYKCFIINNYQEVEEYHKKCNHRENIRLFSQIKHIFLLFQLIAKDKK